MRNNIGILGAGDHGVSSCRYFRFSSWETYTSPGKLSSTTRPTASACILSILSAINVSSAASASFALGFEASSDAAESSILGVAAPDGAGDALPLTSAAPAPAPADAPNELATPPYLWSQAAAVEAGPVPPDAWRCEFAGADDDDNWLTTRSRSECGFDLMIFSCAHKRD